jgi:predicted transcriptional regulator
VSDAHARREDPAESHWAAESVNAGTNRGYVITVFRRVGAPMTDEELVAVYHTLANMGVVGTQSDSGIRSRRNELTKEKFGAVIKRSERNGTTMSGNSAARWELA